MFKHYHINVLTDFFAKFCLFIKETKRFLYDILEWNLSNQRINLLHACVCLEKNFLGFLATTPQTCDNGGEARTFVAPAPEHYTEGRETIHTGQSTSCVHLNWSQWKYENKGKLLWFHQYSFISLLSWFIELQFLITHCIDRIIG